MTKSKEYDDWVRFLSERGDKVTVASQRDAELCDVVVCRLKTSPLLLSDNLVGNCETCFRMIQYRPHAPTRPRKLCDECARKEMAKDEEHQFHVTRNTMYDVLDYYVRKSRH